MNIWISYPSIYIPERDAGAVQISERKVDPAYRRLLSAYSHPELDENLADRGREDAEDLIISASKPLLQKYPNHQQPTFFVDCRSSPAIGVPAPTYKAALGIGLPRVIPFSLSGQDGCELATALLLLGGLLQNQHRVALISATQRVVVPDLHQGIDQVPGSDASAAILVSRDAMTPGLRLVAVGIGQAPITGNLRYEVGQLWLAVTQRFAISSEATTWAIAHRHSDTFSSSVRELLPVAQWFVRDTSPDADLGCTDVLVSLSSFLQSSSFKEGSQGALWLAGRFGTIGVLVLSAEEGAQQVLP